MNMRPVYTNKSTEKFEIPNDLIGLLPGVNTKNSIDLPYLSGYKTFFFSLLNDFE